MRAGRLAADRADGSGLCFQKRRLYACVRTRRSHGGMRGLGKASRRSFAKEKERADRNALILFQSGEESLGGAQAVVDSGIFEETRTDRIFALHLWPGLPKGKIFSKAGAVLAQNAEADIFVSCPQSHAADDGPDSLAAAARLKLSLEKDISLLGDAKNPCLLKFGRLTMCDDAEVMHGEGLSADIKRIERSLNSLSGNTASGAGAAFGARNIIGGCYKLEGTLRALDSKLFSLAVQK